MSRKPKFWAAMSNAEHGANFNNAGKEGGAGEMLTFPLPTVRCKWSI